MKKIVALVSVAILMSGCGRVENWWSHKTSKWIGIDRVVTLYAANGTVIKSWTVDNEIEYPGTGMRFIDEKGNTVTISGTIIAEEK